MKIGCPFDQCGSNRYTSVLNGMTLYKHETMVLVIGYGNTLRSDDGVGQHVANEVAAQGWPGVKSLAVTQLSPELASDIAQAVLVIFVDAVTSEAIHAVQAIEITTRVSGTGVMTHHATPQGLMALAGTLYDKQPRAILISVPGTDFGLGEKLSPLAAQGAEMALRLIGFQVVKWASLCSCRASCPANAEIAN